MPVMMTDQEGHDARGFPAKELRLFAISASLLAHLVVGFVLALLVLDPPAASIGGQGNEVMAATVADTNLDQNFAEVELAAEVPDALGQSDEQMPEFDELMPVSDADLSALRSGEIATLGGAGNDAGEGTTGSGAGGVASFFGVEARGNRFAFVVDVSGSMKFDQRLEYLKVELREAVGALLEHTHFTIWSFNSRAFPITGVRWVGADDASKERVQRSVRTMDASGSTVPDEALRQVFAMRPRPDAIYFMTDGDFEGRGDDLAELIAALNEKGFRRVPIYCITLVDRSGEAIMRRIASESGGEYRHVAGGSGP